MNIIDIKDLPYMQPTALGGSEASIYKLVDDRILKNLELVLIIKLGKTKRKDFFF